MCAEPILFARGAAPPLLDPTRGAVEADVAAPPDEAVEVEEAVEETVETRERTIHLPRYHVILLDDDDHTYAYVIEMLGAVFGHSTARAFRMACEVDLRGRVVVDTTTKERAELKRDQVHAYGPDWRIPHCKGSMSCTLEPAE